MSGLRVVGWLVAAVALLGSGCSRQDAERLGCIGRNGAHKAESWLADLSSSVTGGWQSVPSVSETGLDVRVSARLRWEKSLAETTIAVEAKGNVVELKGTVQDLPQRRRAVELAASTLGVEKVNDLLQIPGEQP